MEAGTLLWPLRLGPDFAAHGFYQTLADGQPQPRATMIPVLGGIHLCHRSCQTKGATGVNLSSADGDNIMREEVQEHMILSGSKILRIARLEETGVNFSGLPLFRGSLSELLSVRVVYLGFVKSRTVIQESH